ncbi:hypothetical protein CR205_02240 [Alteribacter lacisalsi]|uniref:ABC-2 type transporter transmembrane domain-containing protein n=1 Tax=Alteribacter lacisalsi TaxID=2045244 RepID=A0A2W0HKQ2_9BACI|nr:YhgE/Pip domain-containing protein [Alteribacter lacisalsi]PYZ97439.1 hypothetical protein CR205_02240 [Alteribacter lacisalsi]
MNGLKNELKGIFERKKLMVALAGIMLMPLLYGGVLIWSFWDPYGQIDSLPVAVVNDDESAVIDGEEIRAGDDFTEELAANPDLDFHFVNEETARQGMADFDYYFYVYIPPSFSEDIVSVAEQEPVKGTLYYEVNSDYNYVSSQIAGTAVESMERELSEALTLAYAEVANDSFSRFTKLVNEVKDGTGEIQEGSSDAYEGSLSLNSGLLEIEAGTADLAAGAEELEAGITTFDEEWDSLTRNLDLDRAEETHGELRERTERMEQFLEDGRVTEAAQEFDRIFDQAEALGDDIAQFQDILTDGEERMADIQSELNEYESKWNSLYASLEGSAEDAGSRLDEAAAFADQIEERLEGLEKRLSEPFELVEEMEDHYRQLPEAAGEDWEEREELAAWYEQGLEQFEKIPDHQERLKNQVADGRSEISRFRQTIEEAEEAAEDLAETGKEALAAAGHIKEKVGTSENILRSLNERADRLKEKLETVESLEERVDPADGEEQLKEVVQDLNMTLERAEEQYNLALNQGEEVSEGLSQLAAGAERTSEGTFSLVDRLDEAAEGSSSLAGGLDDLSSGTDELHKNVAEVAEVMGGLDPGRQHELMAATPVEAMSGSTDSDNDYSYGEGLTPYFLSIGLYVGALTLSIIYPFREPLGPHRNGFEWFTGKLGVALMTGAAQVTILLAFLFFVLQLDVASPVSFIWFTYLVSAVFISLIFMMVGVLDNPGRFVAIILLILQLGGSGGTFPVELLASPLQTVHGWLPMTYSILGFRSVVFMDSPVFLGQSVLFLTVLGAVVLGGAYFFFRAKYSKLCAPFTNKQNVQTNKD